MTQRPITRRSFLRAAALTGTALAVPTLLSACGAANASAQPIGVQLYTVRDLMAQDVAGTLAQIGALGYQEVEFAGYFDQSYADIKGWLAESGLTAPSAHVSHQVFKENFEAAVEAATVLGHKNLFLSWLPPEDRTVQRYYAITELLNKNGEIAKSAGIQLGFHNHEFEFENHGGLRGYDIFLNNTDRNLVKFELDLYWTRVAGVEPLPLVQAHPGRFPCVHVKDYGADGSIVDVGDGSIDFGGLYAPLRKAGVKHFFIERDNSPAPMETLTRSIKAFQSMIGR
ncbi:MULTISPECIES: sugar phosphate isomerase/epimerase family protein [Kordiimonas]|jgi:sugar phosphate isomerase/epimerase|uniref:sugar phosphate isomerase/epimerase family protein n=1 Tax=Kordiimonas TaxID=288021 RepID=UPI00257A3B4D|nr:sugar phosphate isomerase/epimerase [Kordiimonas sp. UBA4487]